MENGFTIVHVEKLAEEIATEVFELQVASGYLKKDKMLSYKELEMGRHTYALTEEGKEKMTQLIGRWKKKIMES